MDPTQGMDTDPLDAFLTDESLDDPQGDADFEAAFNNTRAQTHGEGPTSNAAAHQDGGEPGAQKSEPAGEDPAAVAAAAQAAAAAEAAAQLERDAAEANAPVTITRSQMDAMTAALALVPKLEQRIQQSHDSMAGRFGSLNQAMETLKAQASKGGIPAIKALARIEKEFPELGVMLREDLTDAFGQGHVPADAAGQHDDGAAAAPPAPADPLQDPRVVQALQQKEMTIVDAIHPGWRGATDANGARTPGLIDTPAFKEWRAGLPKEAQDLLGSTWDSNILKDAIAHFKTWDTERNTRAQVQAQAQADASKQRDKRLNNAVPATTGKPTGINVIDEDAEFAAGVEKARGGRR